MFSFFFRPRLVSRRRRERRRLNRLRAVRLNDRRTWPRSTTRGPKKSVLVWGKRARTSARCVPRRRTRRTYGGDANDARRRLTRFRLFVFVFFFVVDAAADPTPDPFGFLPGRRARWSSSMVARHRWSSGELGSPSAERPVICRAKPLNSAFCCRDACSETADWSGGGYRGGGFGNLGRPLPRFGFGRRRNTGAGVGGRAEAVSASMSTSSMPRRALNSSSRAPCPSWLDARRTVDELTRSHHDRCDSPVASARPRAVPDAFRRTPRFGRGLIASLHQHGDGPTSAIAPSGVNLGAPRER